MIYPVTSNFLIQLSPIEQSHSWNVGFWHIGYIKYDTLENAKIMWRFDKGSKLTFMILTLFWLYRSLALDVYGVWHYGCLDVITNNFIYKTSENNEFCSLQKSWFKINYGAINSFDLWKNLRNDKPSKENRLLASTL